MWKWLGGCLVVLIILIIGGFWFGMRTMKGSLEPDGSATITIGAPPTRVFASLSNGDSILQWMSDRRNTLTISRHGQLMRGDTIRIHLRSVRWAPQEALRWQVIDVVPDQLFAMQLSDSSGRVRLLRRDSLFAKGDSTRVVTRVTIDSTKSTTPATAAKSREGLNEMTAGVMLSLFRIQAKLELEKVKARIEGKPLRQ